VPDASDDIVIVDNPERRRYEARLADRVVGFSDYRPARGRLIFVHTEVDPAFERRGIGSRLAAGALSDVRARGLKATVHCPFITSYLKRHREFDDVVLKLG
jgi:predicted GNAT family acetyltransferase